MGFSINTISSKIITEMIEKKVWREECPVHISRLKEVVVLYYDFEGKQNEGRLIVLDKISEAVKSIFEELFELTFPIYSLRCIEDFNGDDELSMNANNSSAYNGRLVARTNSWSSHAYGLAIDINPIQNPYLLLDDKRELIEVIPSAGSDYLDRESHQKGMVESIVPIFAKYGFTEWGGSWMAKPDFHHFQVPWHEIRKLFAEH